MDIRSRRTALGWSRKQLSAFAQVDASVVQLIELGQWADDEAIAKVDKALTEAEKAAPAPKPDGTIN